jgi:hypothetical protein
MDAPSWHGVGVRFRRHTDGSSIMSVETSREAMLTLLEKLHGCANQLKSEVIALRQTIRFDDHAPSARDAAGRIESELSELAEGLRHFREAFEARNSPP